MLVSVVAAIYESDHFYIPTALPLVDFDFKINNFEYISSKRLLFSA